MQPLTVCPLFAQFILLFESCCCVICLCANKGNFYNEIKKRISLILKFLRDIGADLFSKWLFTSNITMSCHLLSSNTLELYFNCIVYYSLKRISIQVHFLINGKSINELILYWLKSHFLPRKIFCDIEKFVFIELWKNWNVTLFVYFMKQKYLI